MSLYSHWRLQNSINLCVPFLFKISNRASRTLLVIIPYIVFLVIQVIQPFLVHRIRCVRLPVRSCLSYR